VTFVYQIDRIARVAFNIARKRGGKLCSVDKANVLEVIIVGLSCENLLWNFAKFLLLYWHVY